MNMTAFMNAMSNPQNYVMQQFAQQMINEHPKEWQECQQMFQGKKRAEQINTLRKLYKSKGMDLDNVAKQYGIAI